ncbi:MAG: hypothetical protein JSS04_01890 [Proteobacteria bacterium]|nr:hypothetical protein [Pseudomonadota bacterium]
MLLLPGVGRWRRARIWSILGRMKPVTRGLITSIFWLGLALGFTGALSKFLQNQHVVETR